MGWDNGAIVEARLHYIVNGQRCMNVLHYTPSGDTLEHSIKALSQALCSTLWDVPAGALTPLFQSCMSTTVQVESGWVQQIHPTRYRAASIGIGVFGTRVGPCHAQNLQACITKQGEIAKRSGQGGIRVGGLPTAEIQNGLLMPDLVAALLLVRDAIKVHQQDGLSQAVYVPSILNKQKIPNSDPPKWEIVGKTEVTETVLQPEARTMSRRTIGKGV